MAIHARTFPLALALGFLMLPTVSHAKGADGVVVLQGRIRHASSNADAVSFKFTGKVSFSYFTAAPGDPARKRINLEFDVRSIPVRIPTFGGNEYDNEGNPFRVTYKNAVEHAMEASRSGERADIALIEPVLSYGVNGILRKIECARGQVIPDHLEHDSPAPG
jgi:hypothetical protein